MSRPERAVAADNEVQELVAKARKAQAIYEGFSQEQVDAIVRGMAKYVYDNAETLARMAVEETGIGNYEDKILKKKGKARDFLPFRLFQMTRALPFFLRILSS